MPTFLSDPPPTVYLVLVAVAAVALVLWYRTQDRRSLLRLAAAAGLLGGLFAVDSLFESPREEAVRRVNEMVEAINARHMDRVVPHVSERFDYHGTKKASFQNAHAWAVLRDNGIRIAVWDFSREYVEQPDPDTVVVGFMGKGEGHGGQGLAYFRATFGRDPDGAFRLRTFAAYEDPLKKATVPEIILPGLP